MPPPTPLVNVALQLAHAWGFVGLLLGGFLGFVLSLVAERSDAMHERRSLQPGGSGGGFPLPGQSLRGEAIVASGAVWVLPLLAILIVTTTAVLPPVVGPPGAALPRPFTTTTAEPLLLWAVLPFVVPEAVTSLIQLAGAAAGRGRPAPLRRATRLGRRAVIAALCLGAGVYEWSYGLQPTRVAVVAAALLLPPVWAALAARTGGPGTRLPILLALAGLALGEAPHELDRNTFLMVSAILLNAALPAIVACAALHHARLGRRTLDALGIEVDAPGDLAAASLLIAPLLYAVVGIAIEVSGSYALVGTLIEDAYALHWTPLLTSALFAAAVLYLGRIVGEARGAARERAAREEARTATAPTAEIAQTPAPQTPAPATEAP